MPFSTSRKEEKANKKRTQKTRRREGKTEIAAWSALCKRLGCEDRE